MTYIAETKDDHASARPIAWKRSGLVGVAALAVVVGLSGFLRSGAGRPLLMGIAHRMG